MNDKFKKLDELTEFLVNAAVSYREKHNLPYYGTANAFFHAYRKMLDADIKRMIAAGEDNIALKEFDLALSSIKTLTDEIIASKAIIEKGL